MKEVRNEKGFTLIELAIVLVIIGIIIGVVLKGQDLIEGARHKRLSAEVKQWEVATWSYLDRTGRFPGDSNRDGTIGNTTGDNVRSDFTNSELASAPSTNTLSLGSSTFYLFLGRLTGTRSNIIAVCVSDSCGTAFTEDADLDFGRSVDSSIDGRVDGEAGRVRATSSYVTGTSATWIATAPTNPTYVGWTSATRAILYFFDRRP